MGNFSGRLPDLRSGLVNFGVPKIRTDGVQALLRMMRCMRGTCPPVRSHWNWTLRARGSRPSPGCPRYAMGCERVSTVQQRKETSEEWYQAVAVTGVGNSHVGFWMGRHRHETPRTGSGFTGQNEGATNGRTTRFETRHQAWQMGAPNLGAGPWEWTSPSMDPPFMAREHQVAHRED